jgi:hypothetical protein
MSIQLNCPSCGDYSLEKSRSRSQFEKIVKVLTPLRTYRCHHCNWRGWISKRRVMSEPSLLRIAATAVGWLLLALVLGVLLANFIFGR